MTGSESAGVGRGTPDEGDGAPALEVGSRVEVEIGGIAGGGAGVGRLPDGRVVFVHRTAPDETVRARVSELRRSWGRAELIDVVDPSPRRREAPCPHYDRCGGCVLEHLEYAGQLRAKGRIVSDALERIGGAAVETPDVVASPSEFRYRNRITLTLLRLAGGRVVAGFHALEDPDRIVDVGGECLLPSEAIAGAWNALREAWGPGAGRLPGGRRIRLTLREASGGLLLVIHGGRGRGDPEHILESVPGLESVWWEPPGEEPRHVAGAGAVTAEWHGERFTVRGTAFLQVNPEAAPAMESHVLEVIGDVEGLHVVDAYCGLGLYARKLARRGAEVTGIELDPGAVAGAREDAPEGVRILEGAVEERLPGALPADVVVLNPPRTGLEERVPGILVDAGPPRIVYVSCDAATLARDVERLRPGYALQGIRSFDLFPQTAHVETVAVFARGARGGGRSGTS